MNFAFKPLALTALLAISHTAAAETIVCTGMLKASGAAAGIARDHAPIDIDKVVPPEDYDTNGNFNGHPLVLDAGDFKVTAKRSVNDTRDVTLEVWSARSRLFWASGIDHVQLGFQGRPGTDTYANINCYTSATWKAMNARICTNPADNVQPYCDSLNEDRARNFPE